MTYLQYFHSVLCSTPRTTAPARQHLPSSLYNTHICLAWRISFVFQCSETTEGPRTRACVASFVRTWKLTWIRTSFLAQSAAIHPVAYSIPPITAVQGLIEHLPTYLPTLFPAAVVVSCNIAPCIHNQNSVSTTRTLFRYSLSH